MMTVHKVAWVASNLYVHRLDVTVLLYNIDRFDVWYLVKHRCALTSAHSVELQTHGQDVIVTSRYRMLTCLLFHFQLNITHVVAVRRLPYNCSRLG
jgi:hypothetical protein